MHVEDSTFLNDLPESWYSSDGYADKLIEYLTERNEQESLKPFFAYLPFSAPHWPLQAPEKNMKKYKGLYADGPEALRRRRLERLQKLGIIAPTTVPHPVVGMAGEEDEHQWDRLDEDTRQKSARAMEAYAGMVDRMDWNIGRVLEYLKKTGQYENTLIMFMSDNGAEGASYEAAPILGDQMMAHIAKYYDNSLENIGRANSFVWYGNYWAQAATAPSRLFKMFSTEGGCRVPLIVKPALQSRPSPRAETIATDSIITDAFCTVMDIVPTILELAGLQHPGKEYAGRPIAQLRGRSWKSFLDEVSLAGSTTRSRLGVRGIPIHSPDYAAGFEIAGSGALRRGDYKITFVPAPRGPQRWELFNIRTDPGETQDLSTNEPTLFKELLALWEDYRQEVGVVGLAGEFRRPVPGEKTSAVDEFSDPYAWIKYIGRPDITPESLKGVVPTNVK